ncbi:MAG: flagellar export protein FliJ [Pseudomonadota bacterium]
MVRSERLQPLIRLAANREEQAALALARARENLANQEAKLEDLDSYRGEYRQVVSSAGGQGVSGRQVRGFHGFLGQLDQAVEGQLQVIERARTEVEQRRQEWLAARVECQRMDLVIERFQDDEAWHEARREQKVMDEFAGQLALRNGRNDRNGTS